MYAYLVIEDFKVKPDVITKIVGVRPTKTVLKSDSIGASKLKYKSHRWEYRVDAKAKYELNVLIGEIFKKFKNKARLSKAISKGKAELVCVFYTDDRTPTIEISAKNMQMLADVKCGFGLDYSWLGRV